MKLRGTDLEKVGARCLLALVLDMMQGGGGRKMVGVGVQLHLQGQHQRQVALKLQGQVDHGTLATLRGRQPTGRPLERVRAHRVGSGEIDDRHGIIVDSHRTKAKP